MPEFFWLPIEIEEIQKEHITIATGQRIPLTKDRLKSIPLTEEWFVKFKAIEKKVAGCVSEWQIFINNFELNWDSDSGLVIFLDDSNESITLSHIRYVHQFQNLYFDLKGEELIIKS